MLVSVRESNIRPDGYQHRPYQTEWFVAGKTAHGLCRLMWTRIAVSSTSWPRHCKPNYFHFLLEAVFQTVHA